MIALLCCVANCCMQLRLIERMMIMTNPIFEEGRSPRDESFPAQERMIIMTNPIFEDTNRQELIAGSSTGSLPCNIPGVNRQELVQESIAGSNTGSLPRNTPGINRQKLIGNRLLIKEEL